jgi:hypothetical protein
VGATAAGERGGASDAAAWLDLAQAVDLGRPGLAVVRRAMGWMPVHMAAVAGQPALLRALVAGRGCAAGARAANSWTPMHCAAAHNQARFGPGRAGPCARGARFPARGAAMSAGRGARRWTRSRRWLRWAARRPCQTARRARRCMSPPARAAWTPSARSCAWCAPRAGPAQRAPPAHAPAPNPNPVSPRQGCDPAARDRDGCTPLYCAAAWNRGEAVLALDALGCPAWARSSDGRTPAHAAAEQGWDDMLDLLAHRLESKARRARPSLCTYLAPARATGVDWDVFRGKLSHGRTGLCMQHEQQAACLAGRAACARAAPRAGRRWAPA